MDIQKIKELALANGFSLKPQASGNMDLHSYVYEFAQAVAAEAVAQAIPKGFVLVPKKQQREGGYYLRDLRGPIGNCMKFWYTSGYGTKLEKFHWFPTLEDALSSKGGADWFEPWYAPYIDSIAEKTIDFQLADRSKEKAMIEAAEGK